MSIFKYMIELTPFRQTDSSRCGPACVRAILSYYNIDTSEDYVAQRCNWTYENGCDDEGIEAALKAFGLNARIINNSSLEDLEYWVAHRIPVIVDWFVGGEIDDLPNGHSSVVVDIDRDKVYLMDPAIGSVRGIARNDFERVWFDWKNTGRLESNSVMLVRQIIVPYPNRLKYDY